ncbi:hypothetical protein [Cryptosporangium sp. NPDC048952]|uniref:hypothetical protein n=1 Tax=Cryptosporangium sp. NPDC048952 TaxID=3363961 RepID=UPI003719063A
MTAARKIAAGSIALLAGAAVLVTTGTAADAHHKPWYQAYIGTWDGHGRQIVIGRNGTGKMDGRTYVTCGTEDVANNPGVPCEKFGIPADVSVQSVRITKSRRLAITKTNDVTRAVGTYRTKLSHGNKVLTVTFVSRRDGRVDVPFCSPKLNPATSRDICG